MADLEELLRRKAELEKQIANAQSATRAEAINEIRALMQQHGLATADVMAAKRPTKSAAPRRPVPAKYRDDAGNQWSGRGLKPKWLTQALKSGKKLADFAL